MRAKSILPYLILALFANFTFSQNEQIQKIEKNISDYFKYERNAYSVHFNKKSFIPGETVWFKGLVFSRKLGLTDTNILNTRLLIQDEEGNKIDDLLLFTINGHFQGHFKINSGLEQQRLTFTFFNNFQNNFLENESSSYEIEVLSTQDEEEQTLNGIQVRIIAEGGKLLQGIMNTVAVHITDKFDRPVANVKLEIKNQKNEFITEAISSRNGVAKLVFQPNDGDRFTASITDGFSNSIVNLPEVDQTGIKISVQHDENKSRTFIRLQTNERTLPNIKNKNYTLVIHKEEEAIYLEANFKNGQVDQLFVIPHSELTPGVYTTRLIDDNLLELSHRAFYIKPEVVTDIDMTITEKNKKTLLNLETENNPILSIAVLPEFTQSISDEYNVVSELTLNPFLKQRLKNLPNYFNGNKKDFLELDILMITQNDPKYDWRNITTRKLQYNFKNELGLNLNVTTSAKKTSNTQLQLYSNQLSINMLVPANENGVFVFENLVLTDSTYVMLQAKRDFKTDISIPLVPKVTNRDMNFKFLKQTKKVPELLPFIVRRPNDLDMPKFEEKYDLVFEAVEINEIKKPTLSRNVGQNKQFIGVKIDEYTPYQQNTVLVYLESLGFQVVNEGGRVLIRSRVAQTRSISGGPTRAIVFIDDVQTFTYDFLETVFLEEFDEIYYSTTYEEPSIRNIVGIIKLYTRGADYFISKQTKSHKEYMIPRGFLKNSQFKNSNYSDTNGFGFQNFGIHYWVPIVEFNSKKQEVEIKRLNNKPLRIQIQGVSHEGKLYYIDKKVN